MRGGDWPALARGAGLATWLSYAALLLQQGADSLLDSDPLNLTVLVVRLGVLLLFLPGMLRGRLRSYVWLCFVCLLYFMQLVVRLFADPANALTMLGLAAVVSLFVSAMLHVRWRARAAREHATAGAG